MMRSIVRSSMMRNGNRHARYNQKATLISLFLLFYQKDINNLTYRQLIDYLYLFTNKGLYRFGFAIY